MKSYTDKEAKAGLDAKLPPIETFPNHFPDYEIEHEIPSSLRLPEDPAPISARSFFGMCG